MMKFHVNPDIYYARHKILSAHSLVFYQNVSTLHTSPFRNLYGQTIKMMNENHLKDQRPYYVSLCRFAPSKKFSRYYARQPVRFGIIVAKC